MHSPITDNQPLADITGMIARVGLLMVMFVGSVLPTLAQLPDTLDFTTVKAIAHFESATSMDADLTGNLYIADFASDQVVKLSPTGAVIDRWGGAGSGANAFDGPASVDATNGLRILVADHGNGRIKWLTSDGVLIGSIRLGMMAASWSPELTGELVRGSPIAATSDTENDFFAIDSESNSIVHGKRDRSTEIIVDGRSLRYPELVQLTAILINSDMLFVGDRSTGNVHIFDRLGTFVRSMCNGQCQGINSIVKFPDRLFVITDQSVRIYFEHGLLESISIVKSSEALVDVLATESGWYFLTRTKLYYRGF